MFRSALATMLVGGVLASSADAQTCVWSSFSNGTTADANAVNDQFACVAQLTGANFSGNVNVAGNLGIGTSSPPAQLTVLSPGNSGSAYVTILPQNLTQSINVNFNHIWEGGSNGNNSLLLDAQGSGSVDFQAAGGTGNVGISTSSPSALLSLGSGVTTIKVATYDGGSTQLFGMGVNLGELTFGAGIAAAGTAQMVLTNTGNVGIGTTSPDVPLSLGSAVTTIKMAVYDTGPDNLFGMGVNSNELTFGANVTANATPQMFLNTSGTLNVASLAGTGIRNVVTDAGGDLMNSSSDARMKDKIAPLSDGLKEVQALRPVSFNWRQDLQPRYGKQREIGFLAQDVQNVVPEVVGENHDGTLSVDYPKLVAVLTKAVQEQQAEITTQTSALTAQQAEISALKAEVAKLKAKQPNG